MGVKGRCLYSRPDLQVKTISRWVAAPPPLNSDAIAPTFLRRYLLWLLFQVKLNAMSLRLLQAGCDYKYTLWNNSFRCLRIGHSDEKAPRVGLRTTGGGRFAPPHNCICKCTACIQTRALTRACLSLWWLSSPNPYLPLRSPLFTSRQSSTSDVCAR